MVVDVEHGRKLGAAHPLMRAQDALVDPLLTLGLPRDATAWTGADALAQAIGGVIVSNGNPLSVAIGLRPAATSPPVLAAPSQTVATARPGSR